MVFYKALIFAPHNAKLVLVSLTIYQEDFVEKIFVDSIKECNALLKDNSFWANGKNFHVEHLYPTAASSRWPSENLWGIYLAKPRFAWMALWMAITDRKKIKKRQIKYFPPKIFGDDCAGKIAVFNPENIGLNDILCRNARLYLFNPAPFNELPKIYLSKTDDEDTKMDTLTGCGFVYRMVVCRGKIYQAYIKEGKEKMIVDVDRWQIALLNAGDLMPDKEVILGENLIKELGKRIRWLKAPVDRNYLKK